MADAFTIGLACGAQSRENRMDWRQARLSVVPASCC